MPASSRACGPSLALLGPRLLLCTQVGGAAAQVQPRHHVQVHQERLQRRARCRDGRVSARGQKIQCTKIKALTKKHTPRLSLSLSHPITIITLIRALCARRAALASAVLTLQIELCEGKAWLAGQGFPTTNVYHRLRKHIYLRQRHCPLALPIARYSPQACQSAECPQRPAAHSCIDS